jgi:hypothetical protein
MIVIVGMDNHNLRSLRGLRTPTVTLVITFFWSLAIRGQDVGTSAISNPVRIFNGLDEFAAVQFGTSLHPDSLLRGGTTVRTPPASAWITGDYGEDKGRSYLEAGISTAFVLRKNSRYPLMVTIPLSTAMGDEEYFLGPHFAYISSGVNVRMPLSFIPSRYGKWTAGSNAELCYFGTTTAELTRSVGLQLPKIIAVFSIEL